MILSKKGKMDSKIINFLVAFLSFSTCEIAMSKNLINSMKNTVSQRSNLLVQNPYKTCLKLMIFEPKSQNGLQNDPKSIRFIDKTHMAFHHVEKPYKTCRKWRILRGRKLKNTVRKVMISEYNFHFLLKKSSIWDRFYKGFRDAFLTFEKPRFSLVL